MLTLTGTYADFTKETYDNGLLFAELGRVHTSYTKWHLCYYYDLKPYYTQIEHVQSCLTQLRRICANLNENTLCSAALNQLQIHFNDIQTEKDQIESFQQYKQRRKRAAPFELIGKISNLLFGILDAETAQAYDKQIHEMEKKSKVFQEIQEDQTTLIRQNTELNQKVFNSFKTNVEELAEKVSELNLTYQNSTNELANQIKFESIAQITLAIILKHDKISGTLMQLLEDAIHGKITSAIPIRALKRNLQSIENNLGENQKLPIDLQNESTYHIFKTVTIRATQMNEKILVELNIPILERETYKLIKTIPIPINIKGNTLIIRPTSEYFLFNKAKTQYIPLPQEELRNCIHNFENTLICTPYSPIRTNEEDICELEILLMMNTDETTTNCDYAVIPTQNYLILINQQDQYYYFVTKPTLVTEECEGKEPKTEKINQNGIIRVEKDCTVITEKIIIKSHNVKNFNHTNLIRPAYGISKQKWNRISEIVKTDIPIQQTNNTTTTLIRDYNEDYQKLIGQTEQQEEKIKAAMELQTIKKEEAKTTTAFIVFAISIGMIIATIVYLTITKIAPLGKMVHSVRETIQIIAQNVRREEEENNETREDL